MDAAATLITEAETVLQQCFTTIDAVALDNQKKVLEAFRAIKVRDAHFQVSTGYGYNDMGRDDLELIYARIFHAEAALVRTQIVSGTHAVSAPMTALLKPGDHLVSLLGSPYDTLSKVIGRKGENPSLKSQGIIYDEVPLTQELTFDRDVAKKIIHPYTKMIFLQRSRGYHLRPACTLNDMQSILQFVKELAPQAIILVDNCYGEFTQTCEPLEIGADLIAGSLIKNPGGGIAPAGGYIAGRKDLIELIAFHLTAPGLGRELGASLANPRWLYQGLFLAPHVVGQALKATTLAAYCLAKIGCKVSPEWNAERSDIVLAVGLQDGEQVKAFCQIVQQFSPVDSDVRLEYAALPGYSDPVIMAAGTFVQGGSLELSCDAPLREPYTAFLQGGLTYEHVKLVLIELLNFLKGAN